jgi:hypothetical protein
MSHSNDDADDLETLWDRLLSREPEQIRSAFAALALDEQRAVAAHLQRMAAEPGWHPEQRLSAQAALDAIAGASGKSSAL